MPKNLCQIWENPHLDLTWLSAMVVMMSSADTGNP